MFIIFYSKENIFNNHSNALKHATDLFNEINQTAATNPNYPKLLEDFHIWTNIADELEILYYEYKNMETRLKKKDILHLLSINYHVWSFNNIKSYQNENSLNQIVEEKNKLIHRLIYLKKSFYFFIFFI